MRKRNTREMNLGEILHHFKMGQLIDRMSRDHAEFEKLERQREEAEYLQKRNKEESNV